MVPAPNREKMKVFFAILGCPAQQSVALLQSLSLVQPQPYSLITRRFPCVNKVSLSQMKTLPHIPCVLSPYT